MVAIHLEMTISFVASLNSARPTRRQTAEVFSESHSQLRQLRSLRADGPNVHPHRGQFLKIPRSSVCSSTSWFRC